MLKKKSKIKKRLRTLKGLIKLLNNNKLNTLIEKKEVEFLGRGAYKNVYKVKTKEGNFVIKEGQGYHIQKEINNWEKSKHSSAFAKIIAYDEGPPSFWIIAEYIKEIPVKYDGDYRKLIELLEKRSLYGEKKVIIPKKFKELVRVITELKLIDTHIYNFGYRNKTLVMVDYEQ